MFAVSAIRKIRACQLSTFVPCVHRGRIWTGGGSCSCWNKKILGKRESIKVSADFCSRCPFKDDPDLPQLAKIDKGPCALYHNDEVRRIKCGSCTGSFVTVHKCDFFGECVLSDRQANNVLRKTGEVIASCEGGGEGCQKFIPLETN